MESLRIWQWKWNRKVRHALSVQNLEAAIHFHKQLPEPEVYAQRPMSYDLQLPATLRSSNWCYETDDPRF